MPAPRLAVNRPVDQVVRTREDAVLDVVGEVLHEPIEPCAGEDLVSLPHDPDVLLRHRPRSIPLAPERG
jgi:hypothetical protein